MRILVFMGSGRKGNTLELSEEVIKRMKAYAERDKVEFKCEIIRLRSLELPLCTSCHNCVTEKGEEYCPHRDVIEELTDMIEDVDGIILASPVSSLNITAHMKNLIDHFSFFYHRPDMFDKYGLALTDTAGAGHKSTAKYLKSVMHSWGIRKPHMLPVKLWNIKVVMNEKMDKQISRASKKFYSDILKKKRYKPSLFDIMYFNVWRALNSSGSSGSADYDFWNEKGWLQQNYYYVDGVNSFKLGLGGVFFKVMKRIMPK